MKYAFNTWAYSHFPCWVPSYSFEETIERLARIGYDGVEIGCAQPQAWPYYIDKEKRRNMRRILEDNQISVASVLPAPGGGPGGNIASACEEERAWTVQYWKDCVDLGLEIGDCKRLLCVCGWYIYGTKSRDAWKWAVEGISKVADYAAKSGVVLMLEPTAADSNLVESCEDAINMMEDVGKENVKLMFDTTHALYRNEVPSDYVYLMGENLKHIHMADNDRKAPGTGGCDFVDIMRALKEIHYDGYVTMENGFPTRDCHPDVVARQSLEYLKKIEESL
ncbi:sugar phosphate isomerase/epimerase [Lactonifactor longoviformis]|uniref:sugar phosphate isomerase/epimerase family protein n=1 Tax=Lactonifactor TaxID=420345 RepID=UPI0012B04AD9|nr:MULTISPECIES: sugar phosphate isomerase/epimerase [Lactonifactor]MCB5713010.1 sugar phosphate isomerase/epimerase [Lactonifactor longoviformis]MCB5717226.1 sugar phosphate isomerase/epimerase [Lactonifactor longoviformis]MCQ4672015.1 sugar phosphate isomerase/epimerase [Lactonifactor longoviformis]MSA03087.1 TIM barrel protein [Lactonifactor sp. BIOML-A5]MSA08757.1 TIM barrel protein [Lactonifactor sp. BIOML-A4]